MEPESSASPMCMYMCVCWGASNQLSGATQTELARDNLEITRRTVTAVVPALHVPVLQTLQRRTLGKSHYI